MAKCVLHPGREGPNRLYGKAYCDECEKGIEAAQNDVDDHVSPQECFVWYAKKDDWEPIKGTGCAHFVSHKKNIKSGSAGDKCLAGYTYRVKVMIAAFSPVKDVSEVKVGDVWVSDKKDHTGLVAKVEKAKKDGDPPQITIRHASSRQHKVAENDFATYFHGKGTFMR